jgi:hypothetical protein
MQSAATVLDVLRKRGEKGLPLERLYRQLFNPQLFLLAYGRIYANTGAMTPGVTGETVDGMSLAKIGAIIDALRAERYRWRPVKRVYIPKAGGRLRPLGLPTWSDKLVAEVVRLLLEAYYEPQFSDHSHGFRPGRGCHTALSEVVDVWKGTHWFIEGDISDCLGGPSHYPLAVAEGVEQAAARLGDLDTQALSPPGADVDGAKLAALDTLQHRLPRDPQRHGGLQHRQPPLGRLLDEPAA